MFAPTSTYEIKNLSGFKAFVAADLKTDHAAAATTALGVLDQKLNEVNRLVPAQASAALRRVPIWVEWNRDNGCAQYHPSIDWLKQNGINPDKARCVEISNLTHFVEWTRSPQPMSVLHELAHSYHDQVLGFDDPNIRAVYEGAKVSGRYESVPYALGGKRRAYALTNEREFFAEMTEAYFGKNDFYPFDRSDLLTFDKAAFDMIERAWNTGDGRH